MYEGKTPQEQLVVYIEKNIKKGYTLDSLRFSLIKQGYSKISVENAIDFANKKLAQKIPPLKEKPSISYKVLEDENSVEPKKKPFWKFW